MPHPVRAGPPVPFRVCQMLHTQRVFLKVCVRAFDRHYAILPSGGRILQSLNLKNPRAYSLASEISRLTGESLTAAVITALEQRLAEERRKRGGSTTAEKILAFSERFAPGMRPGSRSADHAEDLYGDDGMPR